MELERTNPSKLNKDKLGEREREREGLRERSRSSLASLVELAVVFWS